MLLGRQWHGDQSYRYECREKRKPGAAVKHHRPGASRLEKSRGQPARQDCRHTLGTIQKAVVRTRIAPAKEIRRYRGENRVNFTPGEEHKSQTNDKSDRGVISYAHTTHQG